MHRIKRRKTEIMTRFFSGSDYEPPSQPSPEASYSSSQFPPSFSVIGGPPRPIRLLYCDKEGQFKIDPEAVAILQLLKDPVCVVSVCGGPHQGKSFLLNQMVGRNRNSGFQVASNITHHTKGLWLWSEPIKRTALDGTQYNLLYLDSEGIDSYKQTVTCSTKITCLALLLSSMFIYNQMNVINDVSLDRLSLLAEMTKHIRIRTSTGQTTVFEPSQFSPIFVCLLRDFYLALVHDNRKITHRDYLELWLSPIQGTQKNFVSKNEVRASIRAFFPDRECFSLVRPSCDDNDFHKLDQIPLEKLRPEFRTGIDALTKYILERTRPKQVGGTIMTGPILARITESYLDSLNKGVVPIISTYSWLSTEEAECQRTYDLATEAYMKSFDRSKHPEKDIKKDIVGEADLQCSKEIQNLEKTILSCRPNAKIGLVIEAFDDLVSKYEASFDGPEKWEKLVAILKQNYLSFMGDYDNTGGGLGR